MTMLEQRGQKAKEAARALAVAGAKKDAALLKMADAIEAHEAEIWPQTKRTCKRRGRAGCAKACWTGWR